MIKMLALIILTLGASASACTSASKAVENLPTAEPNGQVEATEDVTLKESGFHWDGADVYYAFTAANEGAELSLERVTFQVSFFDAAGQPVGGDSGQIAIIWPGETVAEASQVAADREPVEMQISFEPEASVEVTQARGFDVVKGAFEETAFGGRVLAVIKNPYDQDLLELRVSAVVYDAEGKVMAGGVEFLHLLPAAGEAIATIPVLGKLPAPPTRVDVYTRFSVLTLERIR